jgi:hypothetical protein
MKRFIVSLVFLALVALSSGRSEYGGSGSDGEARCANLEGSWKGDEIDKAIGPSAQPGVDGQRWDRTE